MSIEQEVRIEELEAELEMERGKYTKAIVCMDRIQNMCIGEVSMGVSIDSGEVGKLIWEATGQVCPNELSVLARELQEIKPISADRMGEIVEKVRGRR